MEDARVDLSPIENATMTVSERSEILHFRLLVPAKGTSMALSAFGIGVKVSHTLPDLLRPLYLDRRSRPATLWGSPARDATTDGRWHCPGERRCGDATSFGVFLPGLGDRLTRGFFTVARW